MKLLGIAMDDLNFQNKIMGVCRGKSRTTTSQEQQLMQRENFLIKKQVLEKCFGHGIIMQDKIGNVTILCIMPACIWNHINIQWRVVKTLLWQDHDDRGSRRWKQNTKKSYRALLAWGEIWHYLASVCSASFEANSAQVESLLLLPPLILHYEARSSWEKNLSKKLNHFSEVNSTSPTRPCITKSHCGLFRKWLFPKEIK